MTLPGPGGAQLTAWLILTCLPRPPDSGSCRHRGPGGGGGFLDPSARRKLSALGAPETPCLPLPDAVSLCLP